MGDNVWGHCSGAYDSYHFQQFIGKIRVRLEIVCRDHMVFTLSHKKYEATSALDDQTELRVLENISSLSEKTCFVVTHRKAAIGFCNRHLVVDDGRMGEEQMK